MINPKTHRNVKYPNGADPFRNQTNPNSVKHVSNKQINRKSSRPRMRNHKRTKPKETKLQKKMNQARAIAKRFSKSKNKYNAHKIVIDGHPFDSKTEGTVYEWLKLQHVNFKCHPRFEILPHVVLYDKGTGKKDIKSRKRNYTTDFGIYDKNNKLIKVLDVKGIAHIPSYDTLRFALFERKYHVPVVIVRVKRGQIHEYTKQF